MIISCSPATSNLGNPLPLVRETLLKLYQQHPGLQIASVTTTGYGEELVKNAFHCDRGLVETVAHFTAAKHLCPTLISSLISVARI